MAVAAAIHQTMMMVAPHQTTTMAASRQTMADQDTTGITTDMKIITMAIAIGIMTAALDISGIAIGIIGITIVMGMTYSGGKTTTAMVEISTVVGTSITAATTATDNKKELSNGYSYRR